MSITLSRLADSAGYRIWANGHLLGQRLVEADVRLVTVLTGCRYEQVWDKHRQHFPLCRRNHSYRLQIERFRRSWKILRRRGLLDERLVVFTGNSDVLHGSDRSRAAANAEIRDWSNCPTNKFRVSKKPRDQQDVMT